MPRQYSNNGQSQNAGWKIVETKVKGTAAVQISVLPLRVPRYSFRVGSAVFDEHTNEMRLGPFVNTFNYEDAIELLREYGKKYADMREARIDEVEALQEKWQKDHDAEGNDSER